MFESSCKKYPGTVEYFIEKGALSAPSIKAIKARTVKKIRAELDIMVGDVLATPSLH